MLIANYPIVEYQYIAGKGMWESPENTVLVEFSGETFEPDEIFEMWNYVASNNFLSNLIYSLESTNSDFVMQVQIQPDHFITVHNVLVKALGKDIRVAQMKMDRLVYEHKMSNLDPCRQGRYFFDQSPSA